MSDNDTSFTIDLPVKGQSEIDAAARSVDVLAARLDKTSKAFERVGIAAEVQRDKLRLANDEGSARRALERLDLLKERQGELAGKVEIAKAALLAEATVLDKLQQAAAKAAATSKTKADAEAQAKKKVEDETKALTAKLKAEADASKVEEVRFEGLHRALNRIGGPLAEVSGRVTEVAGAFQKLGKVLGAVGPYVAIVVLIAAIVAGIVALAAAAVVAVAHLIEFAVALADVNRTNVLLAEGMLRSSKGGAELSKEIDSLTAKLPLTRDEIAGTAQQLAYAGLRGKALNDWLQRSAEWAARIKFGPNFREQMLSLSEQSKVLQLNLRNTFGGLKIDPLLEALQKFGSLLSDSTESGKAIKSVFESLVQPLVDALVAAEPKIERFFLHLEILALKALIAIKPWGSTIATILESIGIAALILTGVLALAVAAIIYVLSVPMLLLAEAVFLIGKLFALAKFLAGVAVDLVNAFVDIGISLIDGLVDGIKRAGSKVWDALKAVVGGAVHKVRDLLIINSPSKVFAEIGMSTGEGMAQGVEASSPMVQSSLESMTAPPEVRGGQPAAPASSSSGANMSGAIFNFYGVEGAENAVARFGEMLTRFVEGDAAQLGAAGTQGVAA